MVLLLTITVLFCNLWGIERAKRPNIDKLSNKNSPSFIPIPYPKNEEEIIIDVKFYLKKINGLDPNYVPFGNINTDKEYLEEIKKFTNSSIDSDYFVSNIIKVNNQWHVRDFKIIYLVELSSHKHNRPFMRIAVSESGVPVSRVESTARTSQLRKLDFFLHDKKMVEKLKGLGIDEKYFNDIREIPAYTFSFYYPTEPFFVVKNSIGDEYYIFFDNLKIYKPEIMNLCGYDQEQMYSECSLLNKSSLRNQDLLALDSVEEKVILLREVK